MADDVSRARDRFKAAMQRLDTYGAIGAEDFTLREALLLLRCIDDAAVLRSAWERLDARLTAIDAALRRSRSDYPGGDIIVDCVRDLVAGFDTIRAAAEREKAERAELLRRLDALRAQAESLGVGALV